MIAISCILMASKYNECEDHVPDLRTLEDITQQAISNETVLQYELWALKRMGWKLNARTAICFVCSYLRCGIILESDIMRASVGEEGKSSSAGPASPSQSVFVSETNPEVLAFLDATAGKLSKKIAAACILDSSYKQFLASDVAIAIVYVIRSQLVVEPWAPEFTVRGAEGVVEAGEVLYLPANSIHLVENLGSMVAVAYHVRGLFFLCVFRKAKDSRQIDVRED